MFGKREDFCMDFNKISAEFFTLSRNDELMEGWPDLIRTSTGKMICVFNQCVGHCNRNHTRIALRESTDGGKRWSDIRFVGCETHHGDQWNSIRISQVSDGRLLLVCDRIDNNEFTDTTAMWIFESRDDGATWTDGRPMGIFGYCSDKIRELSDGTLILLVSSYNSELGKSVVYAHRSTDGGETWSDRIPAAVSPMYNFIEPALLVCPDGTLVAFLRENSHKGICCMKAVSHDGGLSWDGVYKLPIPGCHRPSVGWLNDGRLLMTYRHHDNRIYRDTCAVLLDSDTAEASADYVEEIPLYLLDRDTSAEAPDTGYTAWVETAPEKILSVNYITNDAAHPYIRGYFWDIPKPQSI